MNYAKFSNIYKDGKIISKKDKWGRNRAYTTEEVEQLIDELAEDKDENGKVKDPTALNNANAILFQMYKKYGNPHEAEILEAIKKMQENKSLDEQKQETLEELESMLNNDAKRDAVDNNDKNSITDAARVQEGATNDEKPAEPIIIEELEEAEELYSGEGFVNQAAQPGEYVEFEEVFDELKEIKDERTAA